MEGIDELRKRVDALEDKMNAVLDVVNVLVEKVYDPCVVEKLDKLADYGNEAEGD